MYLIDSNVFLRYLYKEDEKTYKECANLIKTIKESKIEALTTALNISEVEWVLKSYYKTPRKNRIESLQSILNLNNLRITNDYNAPLAIYLYSQTNIKLIDCMIASIPKVQNKEWVVVSYDKDFDKLGVIRKEPGKIKSN